MQTFEGMHRERERSAGPLDIRDGRVGPHTVSSVRVCKLGGGVTKVSYAKSVRARHVSTRRATRGVSPCSLESCTPLLSLGVYVQLCPRWSGKSPRGARTRARRCRSAPSSPSSATRTPSRACCSPGSGTSTLGARPTFWLWTRRRRRGRWRRRSTGSRPGRTSPSSSSTSTLPA